MGQPRGILQRTDQQFLLSANFSDASILDQSVGHIAECGLDILLILRERVLTLSPFKINIRLKSSGSKDGLCDLRNESPGTAGTAKKIREGIALKYESSRQTNGRG